MFAHSIEPHLRKLGLPTSLDRGTFALAARLAYICLDMYSGRLLCVSLEEGLLDLGGHDFATC